MRSTHTALRPDAMYQLTLEAGVEDELGFTLDQPEERPYATPPMLGSPLPFPGARDVELDAAIRVPFARPMDRASVQAGISISLPTLELSFALPMDRASMRAALTISPTKRVDLVWSDGGRTVTFQPDPAWLPGAEYQMKACGLFEALFDRRSGKDRCGSKTKTCAGTY